MTVVVFAMRSLSLRGTVTHLAKQGENFVLFGKQRWMRGEVFAKKSGYFHLLYITTLKFGRHGPVLDDQNQVHTGKDIHRVVPTVGASRC